MSDDSVVEVNESDPAAKVVAAVHAVWNAVSAVRAASCGAGYTAQMAVADELAWKLVRLLWGDRVEPGAERTCRHGDLGVTVRVNEKVHPNLRDVERTVTWSVITYGACE